MKDGNKILVDEHKCTLCLVCQMMCSFTYTQLFNISKSRIHIDFGRRAISFSEECNNCGICAHYCAYGALVFEKQGRETHS